MEHRRIAVCSDCLRLLTRRATSRAAKTPGIALLNVRPLNLEPIRAQHQSKRYTSVQRTRHASTIAKGTVKHNTGVQIDQADLNALHGRIQELSTSVLKPTEGPVPAEQRVLYVLEQYEAIVKSLVDAVPAANAATTSRGSGATSALLGSVNARKTPSTVTKATLLNLVSSKAEEIIRHPNVFLTSPVLKTYVQLQNLMRRPASFPDVFQLYAHKPTPIATSDGRVKYNASNPGRLNAAVDKTTANTALSAAIFAHDLTLTLNIIKTAFAAPAYARAKIVRQGAIPGTALAATPVVAYALSTQFSAWQTMLDPVQATGMAFVGFMTYIAAVGSVGYVAITTANDQMERVTWAQGVPLWERWVREEERAALDQVASAWGFKSLEKRGDEEGEDWERLRETCGINGMVLDKVELMEGME